MTEKQRKTLDATLRLFTAQNWAYTTYTIASWINANTDCRVTEEQVAEYLHQAIQVRSREA